jgi:hypothetical protein
VSDDPNVLYDPVIASETIDLPPDLVSDRETDADVDALLDIYDRATGGRA